MREPWARPDTAATTAGRVDTATGLPLRSRLLLRALIAKALSVCNDAMGPRVLVLGMLRAEHVHNVARETGVNTPPCTTLQATSMTRRRFVLAAR